MSGYGQGAAQGLEQVLAELFLKQKQRQLVEQQKADLAEQARQADQRNQISQGQLRQGDQRIALDRDQFGFTKERAGVDDSRWSEQAPMRAATLRLNTAQAGNLESIPQREVAGREHDVNLANLRGTIEGRLIGQRGAEERRTLSARPPSGSAEGTVVQQGIGPDGKPALLIVDKARGSARPVQMADGYQPNRPSRPVTGSERSTLGYFNRMLQAERDARAVEEMLSVRDLAASDYAPGWLENWLKSNEGQRYTQAQRAFTEARLRKESGAAIPQGEYDTDRTTSFRTSSDKPENVKQKRQYRLNTLKGTGAAAGRALEEHYGEGVTLEDLLREFMDAEAAAGAGKGGGSAGAGTGGGAGGGNETPEARLKRLLGGG